MQRATQPLLPHMLNSVAQPAKPADIHNWVIPVVNALKAGETAEFLVGIGQKINVLMERYHAAKLISSKWITIDGKQRSVKVPIAIS
jgi:hypothetical protein